MVSRWMETGSWSWVFSALVALTVLACGESEADDDDGGAGSGGSSTGGSSSGGSNGGGVSTGGSSSGGAAGSGTTGGSAGSGTGGAGGSGGGNDPCGGCDAYQMCIYQVGGPGPGRVLCAENPICRAAGGCDCIRDQGECMPATPGGEYDVMCQCDNGLE